MDIQVSSNFERALFDAYGRDGGAVAQLMDELKAGGFTVSQGALEALRESFDQGAASEDETSATIARPCRTTANFCARTAPSASRWPTSSACRDADDHPGHRASGQVPRRGRGGKRHASPLPPRMADLYDATERVTRVANDLGAIETLIKERIAH